MDLALQNLLPYVVLSGCGLLALYLLLLCIGQARLAFHGRQAALLEQHIFQEEVDRIISRKEIERTKTRSGWTGYRKFRVNRKVLECENVCSFYLTPHDGKPLPPFESGQFLTFQLRVPGQPKPVVRCYSLSDSAADSQHYRVTIKRVPAPRGEKVPPGLISNFFHDQVNKGDILDVKAPGGSFHLDPAEIRPVVLIAGGVGVTPMVSMLNAIVEHGTQREVWFFYAVRNSSEHILKRHLRDLAETHKWLRYIVCYSQPGSRDRKGRDYHQAQRLSLDFIKEMLPNNNYRFYLCGPPPLMESIVPGLESWGVPESRIHFEAFGPASVKRGGPAPQASPVSAAGPSFQVTYEVSGKDCAWKSGEGSLLDLGEAHGVPINSGCRAGSCGSCVVAIKSGQVTYLKEPGTKPEAGTCLTCIASPASDLVLDA